MITPVRVSVTAILTLLAQPQRFHRVDDPLPVMLTNRDTVSIFVGGPTVTALTGYEVKPQETIGALLTLGDDLYAITAAGAARVDVLLGRQGG